MVGEFEGGGLRSGVTKGELRNALRSLAIALISKVAHDCSSLIWM